MQGLDLCHRFALWLRGRCSISYRCQLYDCVTLLGVSNHYLQHVGGGPQIWFSEEPR